MFDICLPRWLFPIDFRWSFDWLDCFPKLLVLFLHHPAQWREEGSFKLSTWKTQVGEILTKSPWLTRRLSNWLACLPSTCLLCFTRNSPTSPSNACQSILHLWFIKKRIGIQPLILHLCYVYCKAKLMVKALGWKAEGRFVYFWDSFLGPFDI